MVDCFLKFLLHFYWQTFNVANHLEANIVLHEYLVLERRQYKTHQGGDLSLRTVPILGREGVESEIFHAKSSTLRSDSPNGFDTSLVSIASRFTVFGSPSSIAVHYYGNVLWYIVFIELVGHCF